MSLSDQQVIIGFALFIVSVIITVLIFRADKTKDQA